MNDPPNPSPIKAISEGVVVMVFEAAGNGPPLVIRTRRLLKSALRTTAYAAFKWNFPRIGRATSEK